MKKTVCAVCGAPAPKVKKAEVLQSTLFAAGWRQIMRQDTSTYWECGACYESIMRGGEVACAE